ncbi:neurogenic locus notch homolog protein 2-like, partial [Drosophila serrata]|uniref:neurogenic locus notch homolog protein 2-like n=1 Tax=Drosophila serrata TaxID=7274 RepID=UPI000A1D2A1E
SRLQEKINSLECEIPTVPQDSHLWRGNETHELLLPIVTTEHCKPNENCIPNVLTWRGEAEIQSGDILIVEINDAMLNPSHEPNNTSSAVHATQVYQVTRSGHEHCDVTEGVLLDITPLVVDGRKLVTLYDKDLTEGVNLLIVVSELWGAQCVRLKVTTKTDNCGENADCSGKGVCYSDSGMEEYECQCCSGFAGPHCEEIDACNPSPCTNNGICVDLSQGHEGNSYQCLCPYGYAGKNCQYESDPCNPAECMNGGSCVGNSTHFRCDCTPGFTGPLCQHSLNECESSPCVHGICVDQEDGFRCFCQPGFAGELCNFEYNECESNPCQNGGECIDHIGSYECRCTKGYSGNRCQIKVDFCANKPCPEGHRCIDHGNDFSCECPGGRNGPDCNQMPRTYFQQCNVNPCTHGGTCWSSGDSFYCACRPGYTGTMCEDEFVVETVVSSSEFIVDDANARNFNDKTFGSSVVLKSPIELHNAYFAAGVLAAAIFIVAVVVTICHCKVNQTYRKFSTRSTSFIPILGFSRRPKMQGKLNKHWLSGKGAASASAAAAASGTSNVAPTVGPRSNGAARHLPGQPQTQTTLGGQLQERPFQRHLAMNLENDMYYTVDFSENSQHSPLIQ